MFLPCRYVAASKITRKTIVAHLLYLLEGGTVEASLLGSLKPLEASRRITQTLLSL